MNTRSNLVSRRQVLKAAVGTTLATLTSSSAPARAAPNLPVIEINPEPTHELSPYLYMQFMEPLGTNDSSVEASWDHLHDRWRPDLIEKTRSLSPSMIRWGGLFCSYYRWREAVGPREARIPMYNIVWGGIESNQIGTVEFVDFCRLFIFSDELILLKSHITHSHENHTHLDSLLLIYDILQWQLQCLFH